MAIFFYKMPVQMALASAGYGFLYGLWPIAWIIIGAAFPYKITAKTGQLDNAAATLERARAIWPDLTISSLLGLTGQPEGRDRVLVEGLLKAGLPTG